MMLELVITGLEVFETEFALARTTFSASLTVEEKGNDASSNLPDRDEDSA
jgi:hypothetical protein